MEHAMESVKVWDAWVRLFHWTLVVSMLGMYLTGEHLNNVHSYLGYFLIGLVSLRIFWGLVGSRYARFSNFVYSPGTVLRYLKGLVNGHPEHYLGHNPAGGLMIVVMLGVLLATMYTGLEALAVDGRGPLAHHTSVIRSAFADRNENHDKDREEDEAPRGGAREEEEFWEEAHEAMTSFMGLLILIHISGVFVSSWAHRENLVLAMINGNKNRQP